jgi:cellulose synthase/poly-beta-1,6-N-acetylglucosamine synthase-like glycosyltransferase
MIKVVQNFDYLLFVLFGILYFYQLIFVLIRLLGRKKKYEAKKLHRFAVIISARNEERVISGILKSIKEQKYPSELIDMYVVADNCTDHTAQVARSCGARVYERFDHIKVGKGYALDYLFKKIDSSLGIEHYDGYIVFDADNILDKNYIREMNKVFDNGYEIVTSYRNSKNYGSSWISAGYALWFLRESKYLNGARMQCGTSCAISGTGFLVSSNIVRENDGWKHHLLTEDIEFSTDNIIEGRVIGYCENAVLYDEQPIHFKESWNQRLRWTKGFYQVFLHYGKELFQGMLFHKKAGVEQKIEKKGYCRSRAGYHFQCYDMMMTLAPATLLTLLSIVLNGMVWLMGMMNGKMVWIEASANAVGGCLFGIYMSLFFFGLITTITEWKRIHCSRIKKIVYLFTFPIFIFTYIPIAIVAIFKKVTWVPIPHTVVKDLQEIRG